MKEMRTRIGLWDIAVCAALVLAAVLLLVYHGGSGADAVLVKWDGGSATYSLSRDRTEELSSNGHALTLEIKDGAVRIADSDCPDGLCERMGWADDPSAVIVCAPAKVLVKIQGSGGDPDADIIAGR